MGRVITRLLVLLIAITVACCTARPVKEPSQLPPDASVPAVSSMAQASIASSPQGISARQVSKQLRQPAGERQTHDRQPRIDEFYKAEQAPPRRRTSDDGPADITLNFRDADVREVTRFVIGEVLGQNFFVDPGVNGTITLSTNQPIRRGDVLPVFEGALKSVGARLVMYQGVYRISRDTGVPSRLGGRVATADEADGAASFVVFPMQNIAASEMAKILTPLLPQRAIAYTDTERNVILVAGDGPTLRLARDTIDIFDVNQMAGKHVLLLGLKRADARTMDKELDATTRRSMLFAIALIEAPQAAKAMVAIAKSAGGEVAKLAAVFIDKRNQGIWNAYKPKDQLAGKPAGPVTYVDMLPPAQFAPEAKLPTASEILALKGDHMEGKKMVTRCYVCHKIGSAGVEFGPALAGWGRGQTREVILKAMLEPSADLSQGFEGTELVVKGDKRIQGFIQAEGDPLVIRVFGGRDVVISKADLKSRKKVKTSFMAPASRLGLTAQQLRDVVEYLKLN